MIDSNSLGQIIFLSGAALSFLPIFVIIALLIGGIAYSFWAVNSSLSSFFSRKYLDYQRRWRRICILLVLTLGILLVGLGLNRISWHRWQTIEFTIAYVFLIFGGLGIAAKIMVWEKPSRSYLIVVICALAIGGGLYELVRIVRMAPFKARLSEYILASQTERHEQPYIRGKIVTVDERTREIDDLFLSLPEELQAGTPDQVGTVVWLNCTDRKVGYYGNHEKDNLSPAIQSSCGVTVVDLTLPATTDRRSFSGSPPPSTTTHSTGGESGGSPTDRIIEYLKGLPRK